MSNTPLNQAALDQLFTFNAWQQKFVPDEI